MSFLSVLKAVGRGLGIASGVLGVARETAPLLGGPPKLFSFIDYAAAAVERAERTANLIATTGQTVSGQGKLAIADGFAVDALDIAELVFGRDIGDEEKYRRGVESIIAGRKLVVSGVADVLDSLKHK